MNGWVGSGQDSCTVALYQTLIDVSWKGWAKNWCIEKLFEGKSGAFRVYMNVLGIDMSKMRVEVAVYLEIPWSRMQAWGYCSTFEEEGGVHFSKNCDFDLHKREGGTPPLFIYMYKPLTHVIYLHYLFAQCLMDRQKNTKNNVTSRCIRWLTYNSSNHSHNLVVSR